MLSYCVGEKVQIRVAVRYGSCILVKTPFFGFKAPIWWVVIEKRVSPDQWGTNDLIYLVMIMQVHIYLDLAVVRETYHFHSEKAKYRFSFRETQVSVQIWNIIMNTVMIFAPWVGEGVPCEMVLGHGYQITIRRPTLTRMVIAENLRDGSCLQNNTWFHSQVAKTARYPEAKFWRERGIKGDGSRPDWEEETDYIIDISRQIQKCLI